MHPLRAPLRRYTVTYLAPRLRVYLPHFTHDGGVRSRNMIVQGKLARSKRNTRVERGCRRCGGRIYNSRDSGYVACGAAVEPQPTAKGLVLHNQTLGVQDEYKYQRRTMIATLTVLAANLRKCCFTASNMMLLRCQASCKKDDCECMKLDCISNFSSIGSALGR